MDVLLQVIDLMHQAETNVSATGHEKKQCVMQVAAQLVRAEELVLVEAFVDVVCLMAQNKTLLAPLVRGCSCFKKTRK